MGPKSSHKTHGREVHVMRTCSNITPVLLIHIFLLLLLLLLPPLLLYLVLFCLALKHPAHSSALRMEVRYTLQKTWSLNFP